MFLRSIALLLGLACLAGCASTRVGPPPRNTPFTFPDDAAAYANELTWDYLPNPDGGPMLHRKRVPAPEYTLHCFVVAHTVREFFYHARFDASLPKVSEEDYRKLVKRIVTSPSRHPAAPDKRIVIPGYANFREFSDKYASMLKAEAGGAWQSYLQRGHWRMIMPFSRASQARTADLVAKRITAGDAPVLHLVRFPQLTINHAVIAIGVSQNGEDRVFQIYDPNEPQALTSLTYHAATRTFDFPPNHYFAGGQVNVYEVYRDLSH